MNKFLVILFLSISTLSCSTSKSIKKYDPPGKVVKEVNTPGSMDENFVKANEWFVIKFVNSKNVNRYSDKEAGLVKGKFMLFDEKTWVPATKNSYPVTSQSINAVITIRVKENKARLEIEVSEPIYTTKYGDIEYGHSLAEVEAQIGKLGADFMQYMFKESENEW